MLVNTDPGTSSNTRPEKNSTHNPVVTLVRHQPYTKTRPRPKTSGEKSRFQDAHLVKSTVTIPDADNNGFKIETNVTDQSNDDDDNEDDINDDDDDNISSEGNAADVYGGDTDEVSDSTSDIGQQITDIVKSMDENIGDDDGGKNDTMGVKLESPSEAEIAEKTANNEATIKKEAVVEQMSTSPTIKTIGKQRIYSCKLCPYSSNNNKNCQRHIDAVHRQQTYPCEICGKLYKCQYQLQAHVRAIHENQKRKCELCTMSFNNKCTFYRHMSIVHNARKSRYVCKYCDQRFHEKANYDGHVNGHLGIRPYECKTCKKSYGYKPGLVRHMRECCGNPNSNRTYVCKVCGDHMTCAASLTQHITGKHGQKNKVCACGKSFSWKSAFSRHSKSCRLQAPEDQ